MGIIRIDFQKYSIYNDTVYKLNMTKEVLIMRKYNAIVWLMCFVLLVGLSGCSEKRKSSVVPKWNGDISIELPEGYSISQDEDGNQIYSNGVQTIGGMKIRTVPEGFDFADYFKRDFLIALDIEEAVDDSLGHYGEGAINGTGIDGWREEYFSDVPNQKDRTVHMVHQFFVMNDEVTILDFWIDLMHVDIHTKDRIMNSIEIPEIGRFRQETPVENPTVSEHPVYVLRDLPDGYSYDNLSDRCILVMDGINIVAGMDVLKLSDGVYDPEDLNWIWLETAGKSDFISEGIQYLGGFMSQDGSWVAEFVNEVPESQIGHIHRRHIYRVIGNNLYDIWLDMVLLTENEAESLTKVFAFVK